MYEIYVSKKPIDGREIKEINGIEVIVPVQVHEGTPAFVGRKKERPKADALVTDSNKFWIGVLTADCLPIFLIGDGVVGVIHAGWRGTLKGITYNTCKFINQFSKIKKAILGVCICKNCYEVGDDVFSQFPRGYWSCFKSKGGGKFLFDLKKANIIQLRACGVSEIEEMEGCTYCNNDLYFSYRKEKTQKRNLFAIRLK